METKNIQSQQPAPVVMLFRRDLRVVDNTNLEAACATGSPVLPVFLLDSRQLGSGNEYFSAPSVNFMIDSLKSLEKAIGYLHIMPAEKFVEAVVDWGAKKVFCGLDYTPFAKERDAELSKALGAVGVELVQMHDTLLLDGFVTKPDDTAHYVKFTPFYNQAMLKQVRSPAVKHRIRWSDIRPEGDVEHFTKELVEPNPLVEKGGREKALEILSAIPAGYDTKAALAIKTTELSAHHKFGTISPRESYVAFATQPDLARQLYWRDFYYTLCMFDPHALKGPFDGVVRQWIGTNESFNRWKTATTGVPIIDAAMTQLNKTGRMQGRCRMIVADFLIKMLNVDWRLGEKYFATRLVDYDPAQNNYNWQWVAGTGPFGQPRYRMFSPYVQAVKHDPDAIYIKRWLPAFENIPGEDIHNWETAHKKYGMPAPIITVAEARANYKP